MAVSASVSIGACPPPPLPADRPRGGTRRAGGRPRPHRRTHVTFGAKEPVESGDANLAALLRVHDWICETVSELRGGDSPTA